MRTILAASLLALCTSVTSPAATIWQEGEAPVKHSMHRHPWWYDQVKKNVLSGGDWISNFGKEPGEAEYKIEAPEAGNYTFWVRANPLNSTLSYALGSGTWTPIELRRDLRGEQNIAVDNKPDLRFIGWSKAGQLTLTKGAHTIRFRLDSKHENHGALDCFVLTTDPFIPQGTMKPGEGAGGATADAPASDAIWIEGESATRKTVTRHPWWYDKVKTDVLSGGAWLSNYDKEKPGSAEYDFQVETKDTYALWVRANPSVNASLSWQLDGGAMQPLDFADRRGEQNVAEDNKPDMRFLAWVKAGSVALSPGNHTVKFQLGGKPENQHHGAIDCFVFTRVPFVPAGTRKPSVAKVGGAPDEWFPLLADEDTFSPQSAIDMSRHIPAPAGQFGFVQAAGKDLVFEKTKKPQKFWGCGANLQSGRYSREQLTQRAKYLRKFGVNIVRQHTVFDDVTTKGQWDAKKLDEYDWWFAELKKHGIYSDWSVFYHFTVGPTDGYLAELYAELEGKADLKDTYGIITISPKLHEIRQKWLAKMLQHKNPYTGLRYVDDPALALVEMQNEDSVFFWNPLGWLAEGEKMPLHSKLLRERWAGWVRDKYKTDEALKKAWGALKEGDSVSARELKLMGPWELEGAGPRGPYEGQPQRAGDYIQFLAEMQREIFSSTGKAMRDAGLKCATITTAWQVGGAASDAANTWTDTAASLLDRHNYAGGGAGHHGIAEGKVNNAAHVSKPGTGIFSVGMKQVEKMPFSISEWTQSVPNQWKAECTPIAAFYGMGLQGWDVSNHFTQSGTRLADGWGGSAYVTDLPHFIGQFPALAFALYNGHITEAPIVAARRLTMSEVFSGKDPLKQDFTKGGWDVKSIETNDGTPAEAFAIGRVTVDFSGGKSEAIDFKKFWDEKAQTLRAATGEMTWDYGREVITVHSEKTQAVIGKTHGSTFELPGVRAVFKTPFVSTIFTPLDNLALKDSKRILITALAQDRQSGARYNADGTNLEAVGTAPLLLEPVQAEVKFAGAVPKRVAACDHYGTPTGKTVPVAADGSFKIDGSYRAYYYEVIR